MNDIKLTTLPSGVRVITDHIESMGSAALGFWVGVGTRNEDLRHNGAAHMVEHMLFKGTAKRGAQDIAEVIENAGGNMNAYTSREVTSYHIHMLKEDAALGFEVLSDMIQHSVMPQEEIERERQVILQEIGMVTDTPDELVFDHYYQAAYPGQALGAPILGTAEIVSAMKRADLMDYVKRLYSPGNIVVSAAGHIDHDALVAQVSELLTDLPKGGDCHKLPADYKGGESRTEKPSEQSHVVLGFKGPGRLDERYYAAQALSMALGGGMSSRLFQEVREKRGLAYSVFSFFSGAQDEGQFGIYAGTGPEQLDELLPVLCDEAMKISEDLKEEEIMRVKTQLRASLVMGRESMMTRADMQAKHLLLRGEVFDEKALSEKIGAIHADDVRAVAAEIFSAKPTLAALGPLAKLQSYEEITARLGHAKKAA